jgi:hypothetical protein
MRIESSVTSLSWIPQGAVEGFNRLSFGLGVAHFDPPPPEVLGSHTIPPSSAVRRSTSVDDLGCRL